MFWGENDTASPCVIENLCGGTLFADEKALGAVRKCIREHYIFSSLGTVSTVFDFLKAEYGVLQLNCRARCLEAAFGEYAPRELVGVIAVLDSIV